VAHDKTFQKWLFGVYIPSALSIRQLHHWIYIQISRIQLWCQLTKVVLDDQSTSLNVAALLLNSRFKMTSN